MGVRGLGVWDLEGRLKAVWGFYRFRLEALGFRDVKLRELIVGLLGVVGVGRSSFGAQY